MSTPLKPSDDRAAGHKTAQDTAPAPKSRGFGAGLPESVRLAVLVWAVAIGLELLHQILSMTMGIIDPTDLLVAARENGAGEQLPGDAESVVRMTAYAAIAIMGMINLIIVAVLAVGLRFFAKKHRLAGGSRRLLMIFSLFLTLRGLLVFGAQPGGSSVPDALYLVDGSVQLIIAVAAVLGIIFSQREETLEYTGELQQVRELAKKMDEDAKNKRDKKKRK